MAHEGKCLGSSKSLPHQRLMKFCNEMNSLRKLILHFFSFWMGYDRGDSFLFDCELNGITFASKSKGKLSPWSYPIRCERKWNISFLSVLVQTNHWYPRKLKLFADIFLLEYLGSLGGISSEMCQLTWMPMPIMKELLF